MLDLMFHLNHHSLVNTLNHGFAQSNHFYNVVTAKQYVMMQFLA